MRKTIVPLLIGLLMALAPQARAASCSFPTSVDPAVNFNFWCQQSWIDFFWAAYDFHKEDWDEGWGYSDPCNLSLPLARTFNAIEVLNYAMPQDPTSTDDFSGNILHWGGNFSLREIDELDGGCTDADKRATTHYPLVLDNYTILYKNFFYGENVVQRAATLLHESRHADLCGHSGNDGDNPCPARDESCDENYNDGCAGPGSPSGKGANGYQVLWLWWFTVEADAAHGTTTRKNWARDEANTILNNWFDSDPCFNITSSGAKVITC